MSGARPGRWGKPVSDEVGRRVVRRAVDVVVIRVGGERTRVRLRGIHREGVLKRT